MLIEKITLHAFKGFSDFELECNPFCTLVGPNSGGKTSVLQSLHLFFDIFRFAFGNAETPNLHNPQWTQNPGKSLQKMSSWDIDSIWYKKRTSEPCDIAIHFSNNVRATLSITARNVYDLNIYKNDVSIRKNHKEDENKTIIEKIFFSNPTYVPPIGAISPSEQFIPYPTLVGHLNIGKVSEFWRAFLYWMAREGAGEKFDSVIDIVKSKLSGTNLLSPRPSKGSPPLIEVRYEEDNITYDISSSGGGLRTLLNLAVVLVFSESNLLLFDEPDSHLHGLLQKDVANILIEYSAESGKQIFCATHSADFIAEVPVESIVWIDKSEREGKTTNQVGTLLVDLGSINKADAIRAYGADKILFVEGGLDSVTLEHLISKTEVQNPFDDDTVIVATLPNGKGDKKHLNSFITFLRETLGMDVKIACVTDNDYELLPDEEGDDVPNLKLIALGKKEIENYLIVPEVILSSLTMEAERREKYTGSTVPLPEVEEIRTKIMEIIDSREIADKVRYQVQPKFRETLPAELDLSDKERAAEEWFAEKWADENWKLSNCPGKTVLRAIRRMVQSEYLLTLTDKTILDSIQECPQDVEQLGREVSSHFYG